MIVNRIDIQSVQTLKKDDSGYTLQLIWKLNGEAGGTYTGEYTIILYEDGIQKKSETYTDTMGMQMATVTFADLIYGKSYTIEVGVPESQGGAVSPQADVVIDSFQNISGCYNGDCFEIFWKMTSQKVLQGVCQITYSTGATEYCPVIPSNGYVRLTPFRPAPGTYVEVSFWGKSGLASEGLESEAVRFDASGIMICSADLSKTEEGIKLSCGFQSVYQDLESVDIILERAGERVLTVSSVKPEVQAGQTGYYTCTAKITGEQITVKKLREYNVRIVSVRGSGRCLVRTEGDTLPLSTPVLKIIDIDKNSYHCRIICEESECCPVCFELSDGSVVWEKEFTVPYEKGKELAVYARYDIGQTHRRGPGSEKTSLFLSGYYPGTSEDNTAQLVYREKSETEESVSMSIAGDIMGNCTEDFTTEQITLTKGEKGYTLTVSTKAVITKENLDDFVDQIKDKVPAYGFYMLRDMILRSAGYQLTDTTYFSCCMEADRRTAELCPGMGIQLTTAVYMPQYNTSAATMSGFAVTSSECYPVILRKDRPYLEFDCYAGAIANYMSEDSVGSPDESIVYVSNIADLLRPNLRQPYYKVLYPGYFVPATNMESPYASDNVVILAADSYLKIQTACDAIAENPAAIRKLSIPVIIFRGRSNLSLRNRIQIGEEQVFVPVGTTLADILQMWNLQGMKNITMYRRDPDGVKKPVFLKLSEESENIVLINGDMICL